ncbi:FUSC family protein [Arthrobacter sp.]|uniref:FUSC family protein n=1 Tax=Arthrobacter sp. TaxID=1667 RepID=UPI003A8FE53A
MDQANPFGRMASLARHRSLSGTARVRVSLVQIIQITVCAVGAYWIAEKILGHQGPLFAATSAVVALGFGGATRMRRVLEVAIGCTLGIAVGDLLLTLLGTGIWQAAVVVFISLVLARFLDSGSIFTTQFGVQSLLVVLLPAPDGGPFTRSGDAIVGGLCALLITALAPKDPRREPAGELRQLIRELSAILRDSSVALRESDSTRAWHALIRARGTQSLMDRIPASLTGADEIATFSPHFRRHRGELERLRRVADQVDLAMRNARVFDRRMASVITHAALREEASEELSIYLDEVADAVDSLARSVMEPQQSQRDRAERAAREDLIAAAARLTPDSFGATGLQGEGLVLLLRPFVVDLLEATGMDHADAVSFLPRL